MDEKVFFEYDDVKVNNARFVSGGQTYAMSNITSVKSTEKKPSRLGGILVLLVGGFIGVNNALIGLLIAAAAGFYLYKQKTTYHVILATSGGETSALTTYQLEYLQRVIGALNEAIIHRG